MGWHDDMLQAMADFLRNAYGVHSVSEVIGYEQENPSGWFCETCGPDPIRVRIDYLNHAGKKQSYWYYGDMGEFMRELT